MAFLFCLRVLYDPSLTASWVKVCSLDETLEYQEQKIVQILLISVFFLQIIDKATYLCDILRREFIFSPVSLFGSIVIKMGKQEDVYQGD